MTSLCLQHYVILHKNSKTWPNQYVLDRSLERLKTTYRPENDKKRRKTLKSEGKHQKIPENAIEFAYIKQRILSWEYAGIADIYGFCHLYKSADINSLTDICLQKEYEKSLPIVANQFVCERLQIKVT